MPDDPAAVVTVPDDALGFVRRHDGSTSGDYWAETPDRVSGGRPPTPSEPGSGQLRGSGPSRASVGRWPGVDHHGSRGLYCWERNDSLGTKEDN